MKLVFILLCGICLCQSTSFAAQYTISISGFSFTPASLSVNIGDTITINTSSAHPVVQVDQATWNAANSTPLSGGWGTKVSSYTFVPSSAGTIYYVCSNHVSFGMKGTITVSALATGLTDATVKESINFHVQDQTLFLRGKNLTRSVVYVRNLKGQTLVKEQVNVDIFSQKLPLGAYIVTVINNESPIFSKKFVVE